MEGRFKCSVQNTNQECLQWEYRALNASILQQPRITIAVVAPHSDYAISHRTAAVKSAADLTQNV